ncbi:hypothetical protein HYX03_04675 [Candidatus Woesearchaeota archaeon]|nr:hypothetical protein [Candidatus Woesearchaeota archaeon]
MIEIDSIADLAKFCGRHVRMNEIVAQQVDKRTDSYMPDPRKTVLVGELEALSIPTSYVVKKPMIFGGDGRPQGQSCGEHYITPKNFSARNVQLWIQVE